MNNELETRDTSDLLFGDNLALLYAQGAPKQGSNVMGFDGETQSLHDVDESRGNNIGLAPEDFSGEKTAETHESMNNSAYQVPLNASFFGAEVGKESMEMNKEAATLPADTKTEELDEQIATVSESLDLLWS